MKSNFLSKYQLPLFFVFSFFIPWLIWVPMALKKFGLIEWGISNQSPVMFLGVMTPALAAVLIVLAVRKKGDFKKLFAPLGDWKQHIIWYLVILLYPVCSWLIARGIDMLLGVWHQPQPMISDSFGGNIVMLISLLVFLIFTALGEEIGWRGFALPRLQKRFNSLVSSIILGILWGVWHFPIFLANGNEGTYVITQLITVVAYSIIITWVFNHTRGSVFIAWIFHWMMAATAILFAPLPSITDDLIHWIFALLLVFIAGPGNLSRKHEKITIKTNEEDN